MTTATRARTSPAIDAVTVLLDRVDAHVLAELRAGRHSRCQQRLQREVGEDEAAVGLEEPAAARLDPDREATLDLGGVQHLERRPARRERVAVGPPVAEVERPGLLQQRRPHSASSSRQSGYDSCARRTQRSSGYESRTIREPPWLEPRP